MVLRRTWELDCETNSPRFGDNSFLVLRYLVKVVLVIVSPTCSWYPYPNIFVAQATLWTKHLRLRPLANLLPPGCATRARDIRKLFSKNSWGEMARLTQAFREKHRPFYGQSLGVTLPCETTALHSLTVWMACGLPSLQAVIWFSFLACFSSPNSEMRTRRIAVRGIIFFHSEMWHCHLIITPRRLSSCSWHYSLFAYWTMPQRILSVTLGSLSPRTETAFAALLVPSAAVGSLSDAEHPSDVTANIQ